jgi:uncharacterized membrane protein YdjX (TVP38/TMEM64 family)
VAHKDIEEKVVEASAVAGEEDQPPYVGWRGGWHTILSFHRQGKSKLASTILLILVTGLVVAISVSIFLFRNEIAGLSNYGYLGAFLANLVSNATIILPVPGGLIIVALGAVLPPVLVGLAGGTGAAIGEMVGYVLGLSGSNLMKNHRAYDRAVRWLHKWGSLTVFLFTITPLPFDLISIAAGTLRFPVWKFFLSCWCGKVLITILMAFAGSLGWRILEFLSVPGP